MHLIKEDAGSSPYKKSIKSALLTPKSKILNFRQDTPISGLVENGRYWKTTRDYIKIEYWLLPACHWNCWLALSIWRLFSYNWSDPTSLEQKCWCQFWNGGLGFYRLLNQLYNWSYLDRVWLFKGEENRMESDYHCQLIDILWLGFLFCALEWHVSCLFDRLIPSSHLNFNQSFVNKLDYLTWLFKVHLSDWHLFDIWTCVGISQCCLNANDSDNLGFDKIAANRTDFVNGLFTGRFDYFIFM